ncbi:unnamed protein product [Ectocarpus sp. 4 AP-2014]
MVCKKRSRRELAFLASVGRSSIAPSWFAAIDRTKSSDGTPVCSPALLLRYSRTANRTVHPTTVPCRTTSTEQQTLRARGPQNIALSQVRNNTKACSSYFKKVPITVTLAGRT